MGAVSSGFRRNADGVRDGFADDAMGFGEDEGETVGTTTTLGGVGGVEDEVDGAVSADDHEEDSMQVGRWTNLDLEESADDPLRNSVGGLLTTTSTDPFN